VFSDQIRGFEKSSGGLLVAVGLAFVFFIEIHWYPEVTRLLEAAQLFPDPIGTSTQLRAISG
jgi:hypothetical protein